MRTTAWTHRSNHVIGGGLDSNGKEHFRVSYLGTPRFARGRYYQRHSLGDRTDAAFGYQSTVTCYHQCRCFTSASAIQSSESSFEVKISGIYF